MTRPSARALIEATVDPGSFRSWDEPIDRAAYDAGYLAVLRRAQERAGTDEAVLTGRASIRGHAAALVVSEFGFLGGSIGVATAERIVAAVRRATRERLPLIAAPASGGTRMQEGTPAFVRMVEISRAVVAHKAAGLPYLVYLRHPTTGGVFASWGSLGHVAVAEPGALIGFLGPLVYRTLRGEPFPEGVQVAENLVDKGILDAVVPAGELADIAARALALLSGTPGPDAPARAPRAAGGDPGSALTGGDAEASTGERAASRPAGSDAWSSIGSDAWSSITLTRRPDRPGVRELLRHAADDVLPLHGTQLGETDDALLLALTSFSGNPCVLVGQDRRTQSQHRPWARPRYAAPAAACASPRSCACR
ncbi:carboxyl transferase domain-containing protein [Nonomuraea thailandensis]